MTPTEHRRRIFAFLDEGQPLIDEMVALELAQPFEPIENGLGREIGRKVLWGEDAEKQKAKLQASLDAIKARHMAEIENQ